MTLTTSLALYFLFFLGGLTFFARLGTRRPIVHDTMMILIRTRPFSPKYVAPPFGPAVRRDSFQTAVKKRGRNWQFIFTRTPMSI